jgi:hypothetical protein
MDTNSTTVFFSRLFSPTVQLLITAVRGAAVTAAAFPPCRVTRRCTRARRGAPPLSHHLTLTGPTSPQSSHGVASAGPCLRGRWGPAGPAGRTWWRGPAQTWRCRRDLYMRSGGAAMCQTQVLPFSLWSSITKTKFFFFVGKNKVFFLISK